MIVWDEPIKISMNIHRIVPKTALAWILTLSTGLPGMPKIQIAADLPTKWTKVEAVFEVPPEVGAVQLGRPEFYARRLTGSVFLDDISLARTDAGTPLSPATKEP